MVVWYVSQKKGNDANSGADLANAKKNIMAAISAAGSGDTVYVYGGLYTESIAANISKQIIGVGYVELNGKGASAGVTHTGGLVKNITIKNFLTSAKAGANHAVDYRHCILDNANFFPKTLTLICCVFRDNMLAPAYGIGANVYIAKCTFLGNVDLRSYALHSYTIKDCVFMKDCTFSNNFSSYENCSFGISSRVRFLHTKAFEYCSSEFELKDKYYRDTGADAGNRFASCHFLTPIFNNEDKGDYTLKYDINNPVAFAKINGNAIGAYEAAATLICKDTANGGDFDLYATDTYSLGITNVTGAIDNVNEKLYRTADGADNIGVFVGSMEFPRAHKVLNFQAFGTLIDRNGGQISKDASDFANNYQIDLLLKWSATLSKAALLAETSIQFVRFRYRPNGTNHFVNNGGNLVGDGDPTYHSLVDSSDGGAGSLVPQQVLAKSIVVILILQDA